MQRNADAVQGRPAKERGLALHDVGITVDGRTLFDGVTLDLTGGTSAALMGPSGSGKTSLLNAIAGLMTHRGSVALDGLDLDSMSSRARERHRLTTIGQVFQDSALLPELTVVENAELPSRLLGLARDTYRTRALDALAHVGLADRADSWPSDLSGGERQRVAIARALNNEPALILADEPTGSLDVDNRDMVVDMLTTVAAAHGAGLVIATHDDGVARRCDTIWHCADLAVHTQEPAHG